MSRQNTVTNWSNSISTVYPVAGQDNDTQGFRDNFTNIKNAFTNASKQLPILTITQFLLTKQIISVEISYKMLHYNQLGN